MTTNPSKPFNIAIVGGGISGLILAIALLERKVPIPITIYESAAQFGEIGAGVGFEPCFVRLMDRISPKIREGFLRCCSNAGPQSNLPTWQNVRISDNFKADQKGVVWRRGNTKVGLDETVFTIPARAGERGGVHRAHFLDELVKLLPRDIQHFRKRLVDVTEARDGSGDAVLHFADGTTARHTAVIGCDGIKSKTRELVLGKEAAQPVFSGKYAYRGLIPMQKAFNIVGEERTKSSQMYCGYMGHVLTFPIANGTIMNVVAFSSKGSWNNPEWVVQTSREAMLRDYANWTPIVQFIIANMSNPDIWALFNHVPASTFYQARPRICLLGDAAHASTPHQGAGAGMCVEDCYILSELLAEVTSTAGLEKAFRAYDEVRRPRVLKLVETSREAGKLWDLEGPEGVDLDAFERNACERMAWIWDHDIDGDLERARELMQ